MDGERNAEKSVVVWVQYSTHQPQREREREREMMAQSGVVEIHGL